MNQFNGLKSTVEQIIDNFEDKMFTLMKEQSEPFVRLMSYYKCAMLEIETKFKVLNEEYSLEYNRNPINSIKTRLKSPTSIKGKLRKYNAPMSVAAIEEHLNDVAGVRVTCMTPQDVYMLAEALLKQDDVTLIKQKDYIRNPKENGYRSLHLIVETPIFLTNEKKMMKVEIQLRTIAMDCWASLEHQLRYKTQNDSAGDMSAELLKCAELSAELDMRMGGLRKQADEAAAEDKKGSDDDEQRVISRLAERLGGNIRTDKF